MKVVVYLVSDMRCWTLSTGQADRLRREFPGHDFVLAADRETAVAELASAGVYWGWAFRPEWLAIAGNLKWIATPAAGLDWIAEEEVRKSGVPVTRGAFHGKIIAESVFAMMLHFERRMGECRRMQSSGRWRREILDERGGVLAGKTLGIVGAGNIGSHVARIGKCFDMTVIAVRRKPAPGAFPFDRIVGVGKLRELMSQSDHVVVALASTEKTTHLIGDRELASMKRSAYLYNVGRGNCIDEAALAKALAGGRIAGAGLDVFEKEPLPADSPLRPLENVIVTPHASAIAPGYLDLALDEFAENLKRFEAGRPLLNVVEPESDLWYPTAGSHAPAE